MESGTEFFYIDEAGVKSDASLHADLLAHEDSPETKAHILENLRKRLTDEDIRAGWPNLFN